MLCLLEQMFPELEEAGMTQIIQNCFNYYIWALNWSLK